MTDWTGNSKTTFVTIGASNHVDEARAEYDYYATDPFAIDVLLDDAGFKPSHNIWECACGTGHLSEKLKARGYSVWSTDLINRGYGDDNFDFLTYSKPWHGDIITNPPYKYAKEFIEHALELVDEGDRVVMFLKLTFLEGKNRKALFVNNPPKTIYVSSSRIPCAKNGDFDNLKAGGGSAVAYGWYVFEKGFTGKTQVEWVN